MARHLTWCFARTLTLAKRSTTIRLAVPSVKASEYVAVKSNLKNVTMSGKSTDIEEPREIEKFEEDAKNGARIAKAALIKILFISEEGAAKALEEYPAFKTMSKQNFYHNFEMLRENGVFKSTIKSHKFILANDTETLEAKIKYLQAIDVDLNEAVYLFRLDLTMLKNFYDVAKIDASYLPARNRLYYLSEKLQCGMHKLCDILSYNPYMLLIHPPKLLTFTEYFLESGIQPEHILTDLYIYRYSLSLLKSKIERAKKLGINPLKPWIVRCSDRLWQSAEEKAAVRKSPMNFTMSKEEHLVEIFGCTMEEAKYLLEKNQIAAKMKIEKFSINARLLRSAGYKFHDIIQSTVVLYCRTATLKKRLDEWTELGLTYPRLFVFGLPEYRYRQNLNDRLKSKEANLETSSQ